MIDLAIIPYRTLNFARRYGYTVRDLMMLEVLQEQAGIREINWLERPSLAIEDLASIGRPCVLHPKVKSHSLIAWNPIPPLAMQRLWPCKSMEVHHDFLRSWCNDGDALKVILDFHPFYIPPADIVRNPKVIYWYDLIDNFAIHNVFSNNQRSQVIKKYDFVKASADLVTGVSKGAIREFSDGVVLPNRLARKSSDFADSVRNIKYDFGFTGFITDKLDIDFIRRISKLGYTVLIRGKAYHKNILAELRKIKGVTVGGAYHASEQQAIIETFKIGLIPYRPEKSHDESPIKMTQYIAAQKPVLISKKFGDLEVEFSEWVVNYAGMNDESLKIQIERLMSEQKNERFFQAIAASPNLFWDTQINSLMKIIERKAVS